ncbi:uncharacterized protein TNCV_2673381 [Trichonephila clavipes]|nr:uncharacterized protein TNCV_2673381 [Trichonephila clavipes]
MTLGPEVHEQMFRSGSQSDVKTPSVKFPSKLGTHFINTLKAASSEELSDIEDSHSTDVANSTVVDMFDVSLFEPQGNFLVKRDGMVIQPPQRHIELHTIPQDGYEFIHRAMLEEDDLENSSLLSKMKALELVAKEKARDFSLFAAKLQMKKTILQQKFPRNREDFYPKSDEVEWCRFLLGSKLCSKIYRTRDTGVQGHLPLLSLILYFSQDEIQMLIVYIYQWFLEIGMEEAMCMWLYALFACLEKPVDDNFQQVLEKFHFECKRTGSDVVQSGRPIFDDFFQHLWPYIGNNTANVVFQMVKRLWLIRIDQ